MPVEIWFTTEWLDADTCAISEYRHWEETHCYLLIGQKSALLIDTGLGVGDISALAARLTDQPVAAVATHVHWDHIGGHGHFREFYAHAAELSWLQGGFPLPVEAVRAMLVRGGSLPAGFDVRSYAVFQGTPARLLRDGDVLDLGGRRLRVLHTPGHSPGHMCFWEEERGDLYAGDLVYQGTLLAGFPSTDPEAYLASLEKIAALPIRRLFPGHHALEIAPALAVRMRDAFRALRAAGKLRHGAGLFAYGDWAVRL